MSCQWLDSFDDYATADIGLVYNAGSGTIGAFGRNGTNGIRMTGLGTSFRKTLGSNFATLITGFAFRANGLAANSKLVDFQDIGTSQCYLIFNGDGTLSAYRGTGVLLGTSTFALTINTFYYIEILATINNTTGVFTVRVNGATVLNLTGQNTRQSANNTANSVVYLAINSLNWDFDDLYIFDGGGAANNNFNGDSRVQSVQPNGAGTYAQFTPVGAAANWQCVNEVNEDGDTTYNGSSTVGQIDSFKVASLAGGTTSVQAVQLRLCARKDDANTRQLATFVRQGGVDSPGTTQSIGTTYAYFAQQYDTNPSTGLAWAVTDINTNGEFGYKEIA